jgi:AbrB family looped-hinge helix DNA binding protein
MANGAAEPGEAEQRVLRYPISLVEEKGKDGAVQRDRQQGQMTVPQEIRKRLGLKPGDRVEFVVDHGRATIRPARAPENPR